jgi:hypothetical protein
MMPKIETFLLGAMVWLAIAMAAPVAAEVRPGDLITKDDAAKVADLLSPGNLMLVKQGMQLKIVAPQRLEWPPPWKAATEKYSAQVSLTPDGGIKNYLAGQPFPLLDANDPQVAAKVMWNFSFRPLYTDDVDIRNVEVASYKPGEKLANPAAYFTIGHFAFYNNIGRVEVAPMPTDPEAARAGIRYQFGAYPFLEPADLRGFGFIRYRHIDPKMEDNSWFFSPRSRRLKRATATSLSDTVGAVPMGYSDGSGAGPYSNNLDPDSYFGFAAKIEDFNYRMLGIKPMLACVHAENSPAKPCPTDGGRTVCPENWETRQLYAIEATQKTATGLHDTYTIPRRILYVDSEGWFITASDQYDRDGQLWKTIATFNAYRDRPVPDAKIAIWPFKRMFQTALVDENVQNGFSTVVYTPGIQTPERECWYINMGTVDKGFFVPDAIERASH